MKTMEKSMNTLVNQWTPWKNRVKHGKVDEQCTWQIWAPKFSKVHVFASGWKTARVVVLLFEYGVWVGWGGIITFMWLAYSRDATLLLRQWLGVGWDNHVHVTCVHTCYAAATSVVGGWVGWGGIITFMWLAYTRDALKCVLTTHKHGRKSILVTDRAPCYPKLTPENNLIHESCNHSKGIFCIKKRKKWGTLLVHTSGIDGMWKISKGAVSSSWSTRKGGPVDPQLLQGIRIWQWRWHHGNYKDFLSVTGHALSKRLEKWDAQSRSKKRTPSQKHKTL